MSFLDEAYIRGCRALNVPRGDENLPHLGGDVAGLCDRESWARRKGLPLAAWDTETLTAFALGHAAENLLLDRIEAGLPEGWIMRRNDAIQAGFKDGVLDALFFAAPVPLHGYLVGHIDALIGVRINADIAQAPRYDEIIVVDTKSGVWDAAFGNGKKTWVKKWPTKHSHKLQVAGYCMAIERIFPAARVTGKLYELDLGGKAREEVDVDVESLRAEVLWGMESVLKHTDPEKPPPPPMPNHWTVNADGSSWACGSVKNGVVRRGYCRYTACEKHVANQEIPL